MRSVARQSALSSGSRQGGGYRGELEGCRRGFEGRRAEEEEEEEEEEGALEGAAYSIRD